MKAGLVARARQTQIMGAVPQQSLKVLQMGALELRQYAGAEAEANPFLELPEEFQDEDEPPVSEDFRRYEEGDEGVRYAPLFVPSDDRPDPADLAEASPTPDDLIDLQIRAAFAPCIPERAAAYALAACLDERGFLPFTPEEAAAETGVPETLIRRVLPVLRQFEPSGVFSRDLTEALLLRLDDHAGEAAALCRAMLRQGTPRPKGAVQQDSVRPEAVSLLKRLRFAPFDLLPAPAPPPLIAECEVLLRPGSAEPVARLIERAAPLPRFLREEYARLRPQAKTPEEEAFFRDRRAGAVGLETAARKRADTLRLVAEAMLKRQADFFRLGAGYLRPLTLAQLAEDTGLHESTISRAVRAKALAMEGAVYPLDYFLSSGVKGATEGEGVSAEAVKRRIRALIAEEPRRSPYSDETLAELLAREGVRLARRTVMKYREALGVPSSVMRRG